MREIIDKYQQANRIGILALILAAVFWGGEFVVEKDVLSHIEPNWSNTIRFFITGVFSLIVWRKDFRTASRTDWKKGLVSGGLMGLGFAFQTMGLETINAGVNAFLSAAYILVIPFFLWIAEKKTPKLAGSGKCRYCGDGCAIYVISRIFYRRFPHGYRGNINFDRFGLLCWRDRDRRPLCEGDGWQVVSGNAVCGDIFYQHHVRTFI